MKASVSSPSKESWKELIAHRDDVFLSGIEIFKKLSLHVELYKLIEILYVVIQGNKRLRILTNQPIIRVT